jgi:hypothetical protein
MTTGSSVPFGFGSPERCRHAEGVWVAEGWFLMRDSLIVQQTKAVIINKDGRVQIGTQGQPLPAQVALGLLSKGEARKVRKALRDAGFPNEAAAGREEG